MRVDGPAERLDDLVRAARCVALELDDWANDASAEYGWPGRGDGHAYVLAVVDDDLQSADDLVVALRAAHEATTGETADWIAPGGSFVYLPDGMEPEWYDDAGRLAEALHEAEQDSDVERARVLREQVAAMVAAALPQGESNFARLRDLAQG